ncbi:MAG: dihydropteroate synthase [bacterium]|nr:dihydropteroate synthase [bacterium]
MQDSKPQAHPAPRILGIVNITRDSFSDGGRFLDPESALSHARTLLDAGADVLDLGAASSHPDGERVSPVEEIRRLGPVLAALSELGETAQSQSAAGANVDAKTATRDIAVSIDSYQPEVQRFALGHRIVRYLNDINGFARPEIYDELAAADCDLIVMHSIQRDGQADRRDSDPAGIVDEICAFFEQRVAALVAAGVARERLILDPGMGFFLGANPEASLNALREIPRIKASFGLRVLISVSRKSFLGALTGRETAERGPATLAAELYAARAGADFIRTHDMQALVDGLTIERALGEA